ncbi:hypothetical protein IJH15_01290 [Candidatus Saccharibacteria bacterium]|nr:hypothetical protein [Candidatus Saccharibacteria bacterium]
MKHFKKILQANRLARKVRIIIYVNHNRFCLYDTPNTIENLSYGDIYAEIVPNLYYDGCDFPDVLVTYKGQVVLEAVAKGYGGGVGGYKIKVFRKGQWIDTIEELYKKADESLVAHHQSEKEKERNRFSPID